jgi:hypothetical protein
MIEHQLIHGKPQVWELIKRAVPGATSIDNKRIWITTGNKIWYEDPIPNEIHEHELIHVRQQTIDMTQDEWWSKWLSDYSFRYKVELEGYRKQIEVVARTCKDRNKMFRYKNGIADILSGPIYGNIKKKSEVLKDLL